MAVITLAELMWNVAVPVSPDYDTLFSQIQSKVTNDGDTTKIWTDAITAATGSYIIRMVSSFTADLQFALERVQHEVMLPTARRPSSIYAITQTLGAHIQRKIPSAVSVRIARDLTNTTPLLRIPAYTSWTIGNLAFFNRNDIVFPAGIQNLTVTLNRGTVTADTAVSTGQANQAFIIQQPQFRISDVDLFCTINGQIWEPTVDGLWEQNSAALVFQQTTTIDGKVRIDFGDGVYGAIPPAGNFTINYVLVQTSNYDANQDLNPPPVSTKVTCAATQYVAGLTLGEMSPVMPEKSPEFYKKQAPFIRSGHLRGNNRKNLTALALEYPGVIDARLLGQAEINPKDLRFMTAISCTLLTTTAWGDVDWNQFLYYMTQYSDSARHFYRNDPSPVIVNFDVSINVVRRANLDLVKADVTALLGDTFDADSGISGLLVPVLGSLGASYNRESLGVYLTNNIKDGLGPLITGLAFNAPYDDVNCTPMQYAVGSSAGGTVNVTVQYDPSNTPKVVSGVVVPVGNIGLSSNAGAAPTISG